MPIFKWIKMMIQKVVNTTQRLPYGISSLEFGDQGWRTMEMKRVWKTKERIRREWRLAGQSKSAMWG